MSDNSRTLKIVAAVAVLCVAVVLLWRYGRDPSPIPDKFRFVCVATGRMFDLSIEEVGMIPGVNPETGERSLILCSPAEGGGYQVDEGDRWLIEEELKDLNRYIDPETLRVRSDPL